MGSPNDSVTQFIDFFNNIAEKDELDILIENSGNLKTIDELDPAENRIDEDILAKFLSDFDHTFSDRSRPKGPDYLIIDNLVEIFGDMDIDL